jgi:thiamine-monophosphate kinase
MSSISSADILLRSQLAGRRRSRDDVAEIAPGLIATKDAIVEGIHFLPDDPIATVAQKLVRVNVSDIIAKGGKPDAALLALVWPKGRAHEQLGDLLARRCGQGPRRAGARISSAATPRRRLAR